MKLQQLATLTHSTTPDRGMTVPTWPDIGHEPEVKTGSGNNIWAERAGEAIPTATPTFSTMPDSKWHCRHSPTLANIETPKCRPRNRKWKQEVKTRNGNRKWKYLWTKRAGNAIPTAYPIFSTMPTQIWHWQHCARLTDIRNSKCRRKPEVILTSGCPPMSDHVGQCQYCLKVVGVTRKCGVCH